jgi:probable phosphoglycerate mutase
MKQSTLILVRHGNTFEAGQKAVWVGARTNLPLTQEGASQAQRGILHITQKYPRISAIVAGPLKRTVETAEIMGAHINQKFAIDERLTEIDYGQWEGHSNAEITQKFGSKELDDWDQRSIWPDDMGWQPPLPALQERLKAFLDEQHKILSTSREPVTRIAITSNGLLRIVYAMVAGTVDGCKVRTGGVCAMVPFGNRWQITAWNVNPV